MTIVFCNTCCRPASSPFRVWDAHGKVVMGCVDACHAGHLPVPSESARWHNRPEARKLRANQAKYVTPQSNQR